MCDSLVSLNNACPIPRTGTHKCLGVEIDGKLSWDKLIETICKNVRAGIGAIRRAKPYVPANTLQTIYKAFVQPYSDYCSPLGTNMLNYLRINCKNVRAATYWSDSYDIKSADVLDTISWETLNVKRSYYIRKIRFYVCKILNSHVVPNPK